MATIPKPIEANPISAPEAVIRTPENTPVPGGGSWRWGGPAVGWLENLAVSESTTLTTQPE